LSNIPLLDYQCNKKHPYYQSITSTGNTIKQALHRDHKKLALAVILL